MPAEWVVDASLIAAVVFEEAHSGAARRFLTAEIEAAALLIGPGLLALELASIAAKKVWLGQASAADGGAAIDATLRLVGRPVAAADLAPRAYVLASAHRFSAYDATYLALAELKGCRVATLDRRLVDRASREGFAHLVHAIA
jgi:predicted nucleic acid-binding protein